MSASPGIAGRLAAAFVDSKLTPIAVIASILLGLFAVLQLPREEEPQIQVPMVDVFVALPGAAPEEVENRLTRPMDKLLWEIPGVEYLYSSSSPGLSTVIVRFEVGTPIEDALIRLNQKLEANFDRIPDGAGRPIVKPRTIDDVPILALTFSSASVDPVELRRLVAQVEDAVKSVPEVAETQLIGGGRRALQIQLDPTALAARGLTVADVEPALRRANARLAAGSRPFGNRETLLEAGTFLLSGEDVGSVVVGIQGGRSIPLREVATVVDGALEPRDYVLHVHRDLGTLPAVTLSVAKRPGANAITLVEEILATVDGLRGSLLPDTVELTVTRDYGHTAAEKSNELLLHMGIAVFGVAILILLFLGFRESLVVLLAIPTTLALTLLVFHLYGYTLNRITLFALIFSIGILVDDAIVVVENIVRHLRLPGSDSKPLSRVALEAVDEVGNPTLLATWAVIAAILPMAFVGGLMGPYMRPIPVGSTAAMLFSVVVAFTLTPWAAVRVLKRRAASLAGGHDPDHAPDNWSTRLYHRVMEPLLDKPAWRRAFLVSIALLLLGSISLVFLGKVTIKMLPFDNKSEFQVVLNLPEGTPLEETARLAMDMSRVIAEVPEVRDQQIYAGTSAPFNFNGLVRHYFLRSGPAVADIQVNLVARDQRDRQSHDIAKDVRRRLRPLAERAGAALVVAEVPPGPPVLQSLVAEIYGPDEEQRVALAGEVKRLLGETRGVVDIDWYVEEPQPKLRHTVDEQKAALHGIAESDVARALVLALQGSQAGLLRLPGEREDIPLRLELQSVDRSDPTTVLALPLKSASGQLVPLSELVQVEKTTGDRTLHRKNLRPVTYVTADVADEVESPAYALFEVHRKLTDLDARSFGADTAELPIHHLSVPRVERGPALKWDGEWHITLEVFRDLGIAFAAVLVLIAMLMVGWFRSYRTPFVVMAAIPFSLIGILPAHWALGAFFTATSMIGFMAGAGIVVRNSIILVDFIELRRSHGLPLREAVIEAGAVRFRPMLLTALAVVVGASVILADPIFQGLAISLLFGEIASLLVSRLAVPVLYHMQESRTPAVEG